MALLAMDVLWFCAALCAAVVTLAVQICSAHAVLLLARQRNTPCHWCDSAPALLAARCSAREELDADWADLSDIIRSG